MTARRIVSRSSRVWLVDDVSLLTELLKESMLTFLISQVNLLYRIVLMIKEGHSNHAALGYLGEKEGPNLLCNIAQGFKNMCVCFLKKLICLIMSHNVLHGIVKIWHGVFYSSSEVHW